MSSLVISIQHLDDFGKDFVFAIGQSWLDKVLEGTGVRGDASEEDGVVEVHAQRNGREILVHGRARAKLITECGRCLKDLPLAVACELAALYAPSAPAEGGTHAQRAHEASDEDEIDAEAPDREYYSGDELVIDELVRDYLLLEIPMQPRCELGWSCPNLELPESMRGPDGVHSSEPFGAGRVDPRLMPLTKLATREPDNKE